MVSEEEEEEEEAGLIWNNEQKCLKRQKSLQKYTVMLPVGPTAGLLHILFHQIWLL